MCDLTKRLMYNIPAIKLSEIKVTEKETALKSNLSIDYRQKNAYDLNELLINEISRISNLQTFINNLLNYILKRNKPAN